MCRKTRTRKTPIPLTRELCAVVDAVIALCEQHEAAKAIPPKIATSCRDTAQRATWEVND